MSVQPLSSLPAEPLVTVIVPSLNQGAYLDDCIRSVLDQDYPRIEIRIVDGASTDETRRVLHRYDADPRVFWLSEPDRGYADAVNKGLAQAKGELIGVQSADDFYASGAIREAVGLFSQRPDLVMVSGTFVRVDEQGRPIGRYDALHDEQWLTVEQCARTGNMPCQSACLYRRDLAARVGGCDPEVDWVADHDLQIRMMAAGSRCGGRTLKLDRDWAFVRTHANQRSRHRLRFKQAFVRACTRYQSEPNELFSESERKLMLQQALWGEFRFRTRELGHGLRAIPAFLRGLRHPPDPDAPHVSRSDLPWLLPLGIGSRIIRGITWRLNAARRKDTRDVGWPASARWFA